MTSTSNIGRNLKPEDSVPCNLRPRIVYETSCFECNETYIGKTYRHQNGFKKILFSPIDSICVKRNVKLYTNHYTDAEKFRINHFYTRQRKFCICLLPSKDLNPDDIAQLIPQTRLISTTEPKSLLECCYHKTLS